MSAEWQSMPLGDAVTFQRGFDLPAQDRVAGGVPIVSSSGVSGRHSKAAAKGPGVVTGRCGTIGQVFYIDEDYWPLNTTLWVKDFHGNHVRFMSYMLRTVDYWSCSDKSSVPGVNRNDLHRLPIRLPPLPEQRAIASVLGALDDKIDLNRRMCQTLEEMARALFKSWFVDFDPVRAKMEGRDPGLPKEIADLFPSRLVESALGPIPEGWRAAVLGEVVENYDAKRVPLSSRERAERRGPFPYYGAASVMDHVDDFLFDGTYVLMGEDGSVVNQDGAPVLQYVWGKFWVNNHAHVLRGANGVGTEQLLLHLKGAKVAPFVTGAVQPKLNQGNMNRIPFVQPPEPVSRAFGQTIEPMFAGVRTKTDQSQTLTALRDTLLPKLISGELRVPASLGTMQEVAS